MSVRIWGNPRTTSSLNCLFSKHNWKWMNLCKMAGLNILPLNRRQSSSDKKHNLNLRLVLFFPIRCRFAGSLQFPHRQWNKRNYSTTISEMFLTFLREKRFSLNACEAAPQGALQMQAPIKGGNFGAKLTLLCGFWLDESFFSYVEKHRLRFLLEVSFFFSSVKTVVRSSDWLKLICVWKFTTLFFMSISQYVYNKILFRFFCHTFSTIGCFEVRGKIASGLCPIPLRDCLRNEFCPSVLCNLIAPNKRSYSVPHSPIVQLAISEFQKFSLSKRGYVQNVSWIVSYISMRIETYFHIRGSYLTSPWKKGLGSWEMTHSIPTHSKAPTHKSHGRCKECNHHQ